jgi:hypothetical protein
VQAGLVLVVMLCWIATFDASFEKGFAAQVAEGVMQAAAATTQWGFWVWWTWLVVGFMAVQTVILWPVRRPQAVWRGQGRSMWVTLGVCGLLVGAVWTAAVLAVLDIPWLAGGYDWSDDDPDMWRWMLGSGVIGWLVATPLLVRFARGGRREDRLQKIASRLFLGTVIEVVAIVPLDVMVRRKTDCYCGRGTFWAFLLCGTAGFAALGPAVLLPLIARRRKRWYAGHCEGCGYDMTGLMQAERCPECGAGWRGDALSPEAHAEARRRKRKATDGHRWARMKRGRG